MEYLRNKLISSGENSLYENPVGQNPHGNAGRNAIIITPGQVEEATHVTAVPGRISLEELRFLAYVPDPHDYFESPNNSINDQNEEEYDLEEPRQPIDYSNETNINENNNPEDETIPHHRRETQDSYLDIVIFEFPTHCSSASSKPCDLPSYGIGAIVDDNAHLGGGIPHPHLTLCNETTGRLIVDHESFLGYHTTLHIPPSGYLMKDRITDPLAHRILAFPSMDTRYEMLFANCDTHAYGTGRNIELSGQILFDIDPSLSTGSSQEQGSSWYNDFKFYGGDSDSPTHYHIGTMHQQEDYGENLLMDRASLLKLLMVGFSVFIFFIMATCRIRWGTRSDYFLTRMNERRRDANHNTSETDFSDEDRAVQSEEA
mmetsp:Transcript_5775/g.11898  ORF Transcript_5775/g.11898 Transcript_5775/m.11898 type:complete len:373 (+) Transcript_5775:134-1252(+)